MSYVYIKHLVTNRTILISQYVCHNLAFKYHTINITHSAAVEKENNTFKWCWRKLMWWAYKTTEPSLRCKQYDVEIHKWVCKSYKAAVTNTYIYMYTLYSLGFTIQQNIDCTTMDPMGIVTIFFFFFYLNTPLQRIFHTLGFEHRTDFRVNSGRFRKKKKKKAWWQIDNRFSRSASTT